MKTYNQFIQEALISSLIKAAARQAFKSAAVKQAVKAVPKATNPQKVKLASNITGFRSGGANRGSNFNPMKGSKYQFDPVKQTSISNTAPGHHTTPAGIKPKSSHTRFGTPSEIATAKQNKDLRPLGKTPKIGLSPYEKWKKGDYPAGFEYAKGKFSEPNWSPSHMGSPIVDIQTRTGSKSNLPLFGAERREIRQRVKAALKKPRNIAALKRDIEGAKPTNSSIRKESVKEQKSFSEFIVEARKEARPPKEVLRKIDRAYGRKYPGTNVDVSHDEKSGDLRVNQLFVPPNMQGKGIGTRVMKGLTKYADKQKKRMTLTQDPDKGKKAKLAKFYKSHGFEKNRGASRDFSTRDTDIRNPR